MSKSYYYIEQGTKMGPIDENLLARCDIGPATMVWCQGMDRWKQACEVFDASFFENAIATPPPYPNNTSTIPSKPDNYLTWSIVTTVLCCVPVGIMGIIYSNKAEKLWQQHKYEEAQRYAGMAKTSCIIAAVTGAIWMFVILIISFLGAL